MTNFKIGQKVVCIDKFISENTYGEIFPKVGYIYTIRHITPKGYFLLDEIKNKLHEYSEGLDECCFNQNKFRQIIYPSATEEILEKFKLTEEKADIQIKEQELVFAKK